MQTEAFPTYIKRPTTNDVIDDAVNTLRAEIEEWMAMYGDVGGLDGDPLVDEVLRDGLTQKKDGYDFAKDLEDRAGFEPNAQLVQILDDSGHLVDTALQQAVLQWTSTTHPQPKLAVGMEVTIRPAFNSTTTTGVIDEINMSLAEYYVKLHPADTCRRIYTWDVLESLNSSLLTDAQPRS